MNRHILLVGWLCVLAPVDALAEPTRYEYCTTGISSEGVIDGLDLYGSGPEVLGETEDLIIARNGEVLALRAEVGGLWGIGETDISVPWRSVEIGETFARTPLLEDNIEDFTPLSDEDVLERMIGGGDEGQVPDAFRASELIGDFARTEDADPLLSLFGVVDDLLIDKSRVAAVVISPDAGLGLAEKFAVSFDDYVSGEWGRETSALDLNFQQDEVEDIQAFQC